MSGKRRILMIFTGRQQNSLTLILFSPRKPRFHRRCAPLKVSLWRRMSADATGSLILTKRQHPRCAERLLECFLLVLLFRFQGAFSQGENDLIQRKSPEIVCKQIISGDLLFERATFLHIAKAVYYLKNAASALSASVSYHLFLAPHAG